MDKMIETFLEEIKKFLYKNKQGLFMPVRISADSITN